MTSPARATALLTAAVSLLMADFTFAAVRPTRATLISPRHYSDTRQPTYVWVLNPMATWYQLRIDYGIGQTFSRWYTAQDANCTTSTNTCRVTPTVTLPTGPASWSLQTWNSGGYSEWTGMSFDTAAPSASVVDTYPVPAVRPGFPAQLWLKVQNTGSHPLPPGMEAWSYVQGSNGTATYGSGTDVSELEPGATRWVLANWEVPYGQPAATYTYRGNLWFSGRWIGTWSGQQSFAVSPPIATSARVVRTWQVDNVVPGEPARLWALVRNTGTTPLNGRVWFNVYSVGWVGSAAVTSLAAGAEAWYSFLWPVPSTRWSVPHWYLAQLWDTGGATTISNTGNWQPFGVGFLATYANNYYGAAVGNTWTADATLQALVTSQSSGMYFNAFHNRNFDLRATVGCTASGSRVRLVVRRHLIFEHPPGGTPTVFWESTEFRVTNAQQFAVKTTTKDGPTGEHVPLTSSSEINAGTNTLRVIVNGSRLTFLVNGVEVWSGDDNAIDRGDVAIEVEPAGGQCAVYSARAVALHDPLVQ